MKRIHLQNLHGTLVLTSPLFSGARYSGYLLSGQFLRQSSPTFFDTVRQSHLFSSHTYLCKFLTTQRRKGTMIALSQIHLSWVYSADQHTLPTDKVNKYFFFCCTLYYLKIVISDTLFLLQLIHSSDYIRHFLLELYLYFRYHSNTNDKETYLHFLKQIELWYPSLLL